MQKSEIWPPGHFYSPIPSFEEIARDEERIFGTKPQELPGINLHTEEQIRFLQSLLPFYETQPFTEGRQPHLRYCFSEGQSMFNHGDAILLHCVLRSLKPKRIIEIGCGWSSAVILDTNEHFFSGETETLHIDPYIDAMEIPFAFNRLKAARVMEKPVQQVELAIFEKLAEGDVLFIDSSHVCKTGSDVEHLFAEVLPRLHPGVVVHFHDIFYPFEYPREWVEEGRAWNETYVLRSFLQFNEHFRILLFSAFLSEMHREALKGFPLILKHPGASFWMQREGAGTVG